MFKLSPFCWILVTLLISISCQVFAQQKVWRHFTIEDGLPGTQVWSIIQAKNGYIWFSTDNGLCWYDGYKFHQPVDTSGYRYSEAFFPFEDSKGRIWFTRMQSVWFVEKDTVRSWIHNTVIEPYKKDFMLFEQSGIDNDGTFWLNMRGNGFLTVDNEGKATRFDKSSNSNFAVLRKENKVFYSFQNKYKEEMNWYEATVDILTLENNTVQQIDKIEYRNALSAHYWNAIPWNENEILLSFDTTIALVEDGKIKAKFHSPIRDAQVIRTTNNQILLAPYKREERGLIMYPSWENFVKQQGIKTLNNYFIRGMLSDSEGGIWVAAERDGVFYCKNSVIDNYNTEYGLPSDKVLRLATDSDKLIYAGLNSKEVVQINVKTGEFKIVGDKPPIDNWASLFYNSKHHRLYASSFLRYLNGSKWDPIIYYNPFNGQSGFLDIKKFSVDPLSANLWGASSQGFFHINSSTLVAERMNYGDSLNNMRTFAVQRDLEDRLWVATIDGLKIWENSEFRLPPFDHTILRNEIRDIAMLEDGTLIFGSRGDGILIYRTNLQPIHISTKDGLLSESINLIKPGTKDEVFICTNKGLNQLIRNEKGVWNIKSFTTRHGLPSNIVHDVVRLKDEIWIGTEKGLIRVNSIPDSVQVKAPNVLKFQADHRDIVIGDNNKLSYDQNNITIQFQSLHFKSEGDIVYRYRLLNADTTYQFTRNLGVNYPELAPGKYIFEVQAQREDNSWTESASVSFEIRPPWWRTIWFISFGVLAFGFISSWIVRIRLNEDRKKAKAEFRMKELELSALRAQINPHFIFNCLGSIQQFIAENNSEAATRYLARFAKLVRIALHSSVDGQHSLEDEIQMLDSYLSLEQMRFKGRFTYSINVGEEISPDDIFIPAMLLQPFVENAVLHGVKEKSSQGRIEIEFNLEDGKLLATITDNGPGITTASQEAHSLHKSVGMTLTGRRLSLIHGGGKETAHQHINLLNESNQVVGSRVTIGIPIS